jgi:hypothetical protein
MSEGRESLITCQSAGTNEVMYLCGLAQGLSASRTLLLRGAASKPRGRGSSRPDKRETNRSTAVMLRRKNVPHFFPGSQ